MTTLATIVTILALAGAFASWVVGAMNFFFTLRMPSGEGNRTRIWYAMVAWPFASRTMNGEAAVYSSRVNKAMVAFFTCLMIAATAFSLSANLSRLSR